MEGPLSGVSTPEDSNRGKDVSAETFSDTCPTTGARRVAALANMAESFLANGSAELAGGDRHQIVVHVDAETLKYGHAGRCELEQGPALAAETARRLACDASLIAIIENDKGEPLNVGRKTRTVPPAIRRALNQFTRQRLSVSRLHVYPLRGRSPHQALGAGR